MTPLPYELAKELKEAGFPQMTNGYTWYVDQVIAVPTLSELIEACGEVEMVLNIIDGKYTNARIVGLELNGEGSTPEIAVAMLWLALNKK